MRRAVNYAIDRRALVQHHLLFNGGRATDHYLVPGIPGSRPLDIYPLGGPDLAKARQLAGGVHAHATLYIPTSYPQFMDDARIVQTDLAAIGITVEIIALPSGAYVCPVGEARRTVGHRLVELVRRFRRPVHDDQRAVRPRRRCR